MDDSAKWIDLFSGARRGGGFGYGALPTSSLYFSTKQELFPLACFVLFFVAVSYFLQKQEFHHRLWRHLLAHAACLLSPYGRSGIETYFLVFFVHHGRLAYNPFDSIRFDSMDDAMRCNFDSIVILFVWFCLIWFGFVWFCFILFYFSYSKAEGVLYLIFLRSLHLFVVFVYLFLSIPFICLRPFFLLLPTCRNSDPGPLSQ